MSFENPEDDLGGKKNDVAAISLVSGQAESDTPLYQPLDDRYIRLLKLLPGSGPDPIRIQLLSISLEDPGPYTALSYVWGDAEIDRRTIYSGDTEQLSVTANLFHALCRFRDIWSHRLKFRRILGPMIADMKDKNKQGELPQRLLDHIPTETIEELLKQENDPVWSSTEAGAPKQFIITEHGFFGTGLPGVEVGDVVAILAGSGNPWYLRKQGDHYIIIGKGWIHGLMYRDDEYHRRGWRDKVEAIRLR
ncbi:hypothetical protein M431DRAFT_123581 [Trichoderma harzianum CBS 226.95]|uniref:Uncharacterized protein n=1 Tax=Trichoderma harzianum CBS 226.95 TaxID=983964 RepID=A0A2T4A140_TRIHA|nr:hypothetical protein M431DRAFT_123581 [Trichoderma harzianum CBS 226.95]PTB50779.1 hypothetical protein M431DRAFT_123581 [Trichoderma harzianum CBS 226.95]